MSNDVAVLIGLTVGGLFGWWGATVCGRKAWSEGLGFALGFFLSWVGIVICYVLPDRTYVRR